MTLASNSELRDVEGLTTTQQAEIKAFLQGAVYCWVKNRNGEEFAARDLFGGENRNWAGTPLQGLYEKHIADGKLANAAEEAAARDLGWLIKAMLYHDRRMFKTSNDGWVNKYCWVSDET